MQARFKALVAFVAFFSFGFYIISKHANTNEIQRDPAAINKSINLTGLTGNDLVEGLAEKLSTDLQVASVTSGSAEGERYKNLVMSQFDITVAGRDGSICQEYSKIFFEFEGTNQISGDHKAKMVVEGDCVTQTDSNKLRPISIPVSKILAERVAEGEYNYRDGQSAVVNFAYVDGEWPKRWVLKQVRFAKPQTGDQLVIFGNKIQKSELDPFVVEF